MKMRKKQWEQGKRYKKVKTIIKKQPKKFKTDKKNWNRKKKLPNKENNDWISYAMKWIKILKTMRIQIELDALTSFLCATNYGKEYLVWRKRWLDPIAEFRVMYTRQTMATHLNFWHPIKPWNETKKTMHKTTMHKFITMHWECTSTALSCSALLSELLRPALNRLTQAFEVLF